MINDRHANLLTRRVNVTTPTQRIHGTRISVDLRMGPMRDLRPGADASARFHLDIVDAQVGFRYIASDRVWEQFVPVTDAVDPLGPSRPT